MEAGGDNVKVSVHGENEPACAEGDSSNSMMTAALPEFNSELADCTAKGEIMPPDGRTIAMHGRLVVHYSAPGHYRNHVPLVRIPLVQPHGGQAKEKHGKGENER